MNVMQKKGDTMTNGIKSTESEILINNIAKKVEKDLKKRYTWIGIIVTFLTGGTITLLVDRAMFDARFELAKAEALRHSITESTKRAADTLESLTAKLEVMSSEGEQTVISLRGEISRIQNLTFDSSAGLKEEVGLLKRAVESLSAKVGETEDIVNTAIKRTPSLSQKLANGSQCYVTLSMKSGCLGSLARASTYTVRYSEGTGFTVTGHVCNSRNDSTSTYPFGSPTDKTFNLWGAKFKFDESGAVRHLTDSSVKGKMTCT